MTQAADRSRIWPAVAGGCHLARDTTGEIMRAGFDIEQIERFGFSAQPLLPSVPHIVGVARASTRSRCTADR
jgi:hypothetical protein